MGNSNRTYYYDNRLIKLKELEQRGKRFEQVDYVAVCTSASLNLVLEGNSKLIILGLLSLPFAFFVTNFKAFNRHKDRGEYGYASVSLLAGVTYLVAFGLIIAAPFTGPVMAIAASIVFGSAATVYLVKKIVQWGNDKSYKKFPWIKLMRSFLVLLASSACFPVIYFLTVPAVTALTVFIGVKAIARGYYSFINMKKFSGDIKKFYKARLIIHKLLSGIQIMVGVGIAAALISVFAGAAFAAPLLLPMIIVSTSIYIVNLSFRAFFNIKSADKFAGVGFKGLARSSPNPKTVKKLSSVGVDKMYLRVSLFSYSKIGQMVFFVSGVGFSAVSMVSASIMIPILIKGGVVAVISSVSLLPPALLIITFVAVTTLLVGKIVSSRGLTKRLHDSKVHLRDSKVNFGSIKKLDSEAGVPLSEFKETADALTVLPPSQRLLKVRINRIRSMRSRKGSGAAKEDATDKKNDSDKGPSGP